MSPPNELPRVSVCVATFNHCAYIKDCLLSVLMQGTDAYLQILVGDDHSTDGSWDVLQELSSLFPGALTLFRHPQNVGAADNYRFLVSQATGQYIAHLDGDDYWLPGKLRKQLAHMLAHPECAAVYGNAIVISESGDPLCIFNNTQPESFDTPYLLRRGNFLNHSSLLYQGRLKQSILDIGGNYIDYRVHLRLSSHGPLGYVNALVVAYRTGHLSAMTQKMPELVRVLYWEALLESTEGLGNPAVAHASLRNFWTQTLLYVLSTHRPKDAWRWLGRMRSTSSAFSLGDAAWGALSALLRGSRELGRRSFRLMHRRRGVVFLHYR